MRRKKKTYVEEIKCFSQKIKGESKISVLNIVYCDAEKDFTKKHKLPRWRINTTAQRKNVLHVIKTLGYLGSDVLMSKMFPGMEKATLGQLIRHNYR